MNYHQSKNQESLQSPHIIPLIHHGTISREVNEGINPSYVYCIREISPDGHESIQELSGRYILNNYPRIFGNWIHAYIVIEVGSVVPIFVYAGPIPDRVSKILAASTIH